MRMRGWILRAMRVIFVALAAFLAFRLLEPHGYGWTVLAAAGLLAALWIGYRGALIRRRRAEEAQADRWAEALIDPPRRPAAVRELREQIALMDPGSAKHAARHARLTLVLAELLEADGEPEAALQALSQVNERELSDAFAAIVRHARAVSHLAAGDPKAARAALDEVLGPCGDPSIDRRIRLMRGLIAVEEGAAEEALQIAEQVRDEAAGEAEIKTEARVLKAVAIDALGDRQDALKVICALGDDMLELLVVMGLPRVRALAAAAIEARDED